MAIFGVINTADGGDTFYEGMVKAKDNFATLETEITDARDGKASTHAAIAEKVTGPSTNTADYVPQWNGTNSKTLKNGLQATATPTANAIAKFNENGIIKGAELNMTGEGYSKSTNINATKHFGAVAVGDVFVVSAHARITGGTPGGSMMLLVQDAYDDPSSHIEFLEDRTSVASNFHINSSGASYGTITAVGRVTVETGNLALETVVAADGSETVTTNQIYAFFLRRSGSGEFPD